VRSLRKGVPLSEPVIQPLTVNGFRSSGQQFAETAGGS
jgi:hypothetical protein